MTGATLKAWHFRAMRVAVEGVCGSLMCVEHMGVLHCIGGCVKVSGGLAYVQQCDAEGSPSIDCVSNFFLFNCSRQISSAPGARLR